VNSSWQLAAEKSRSLNVTSLKRLKSGKRVPLTKGGSLPEKVGHTKKLLTSRNARATSQGLNGTPVSQGFGGSNVQEFGIPTTYQPILPLIIAFCRQSHFDLRAWRHRASV
jgi:hypothetical protein